MEEELKNKISNKEQTDQNNVDSKQTTQKVDNQVVSENTTNEKEKGVDFASELKKEQETKRKEIEKNRILWKKNTRKRTVVSENNQRLIQVKRVTKVTKGGRRFRFFTVALVGNRKGKVGFGTGKGNEIAISREKAFFQAQKNMITVPFVNETIPHTTIGEFCGAKIILKPASKGTGILVGGAARTVVELLGIANISGKSLGSNNKMNLIQATLNALKKLRTIDEVLALRDLNDRRKGE